MIFNNKKVRVTRKISPQATVVANKGTHATVCG